MTIGQESDVDTDELREQMLDTLRLRYLGTKCAIEQHAIFLQIRELNDGLRRSRERPDGGDSR